MKERIRYLIADKSFYKHVAVITLPIIVQNGITNFVSLLDNIMVGRVGTEQMSSVAIVNQIILVYYLAIFGALAGAGIYTAQYFGKEDLEGVRNTHRVKLIIGTILTAFVLLLLISKGDFFIRLYLKGNAGAQDITAALNYSKSYMRVMFLGLPPFMLGQVYASTLREGGETTAPMRAGIVAVLVNLFFNYVLIYGKFGAPALGVVGAATATVISRYVEAAIIILVCHCNKKRYAFAEGLYRTMKAPLELVKKIIITGFPLMVNETLWAGGIALITQCYSLRGLDVIAALNISNTIQNLFNVVLFAMGDAVAIIIGQLLGAGKKEEAKHKDAQLIALSTAICFVIGILLILIAAPTFPNLYNTTAEIKHMAKILIILSACMLPMGGILHTAYFTIRSGGNTVITFLFDSCFMWVAMVPAAFVLSRFTDWSIFLVYPLVQSVDVIKCIIGLALVKKGVWLNTIVD